MKALTVIAVVAVSAILVGCGPTDAPTGGPTTQANVAATTAAPTTPPVKDLNPGNCTLYPKASAVKLIGGVNMNNKALDIGTDGGTKIDVCSYIYLQGTDIQGLSYAVVRYDSDAKAFAEAQKVQTEMLGDAAEHKWPVETLTTPAVGSGPVLGGYGTKTDHGVTYTIAVVGTNVGPYLVAALGASDRSADNAKRFALSVFQSLSSTVG